MANQKWLEGIEAVGLHTIGKLCRDAKMRFCYAGPRRAKGSGRQKICDGKVDWQDLSRFDYVTSKTGSISTPRSSTMSSSTARYASSSCSNSAKANRMTTSTSSQTSMPRPTSQQETIVSDLTDETVPGSYLPYTA